MQRTAGSIRSHLRPGVFLPLLALALAATWYGLGPSLERFGELTGGRRFVDMQPALTTESLVAAAYATVLMDWGENAFFVAVVLAGTDDPALRAGLAVLLHRGKLLGNFAFNAGFLALLVAAIARGARRPVS